MIAYKKTVIAQPGSKLVVKDETTFDHVFAPIEQCLEVPGCLSVGFTMQDGVLEIYEKVEHT